MAHKKGLSRQQIEASGFSYFDMQAYLGTTKHMGGLETTKTLIDLCQVDDGAYILDVGCGVGATASYLAKHHNCQVLGVDLRESMVAQARERIHATNVEDRVECQVADAQNLPFADGTFDAVMCESVATFVREKQAVVSECARVTRPGGYVGMNEEVWLQTPSPEAIEFTRRTWEIKPHVPTTDDWIAMAEAAGLHDLVIETHAVDARREATQIRRYRLRDMVRMIIRTLYLYITSAAFRAYMAKRRHMPRDLFDYLGYIILAGRK